MIIQVRGTSGSGKSTLVRRIMERYPVREPIHEGRRKQPWGYHLSAHGPECRLYVPGHYEIECGGMDTLPRLSDAMPAVLAEHELWGRDVLMEGLLASEDVRHLLALRDKMGLVPDHPALVVIHLTTPIEECLKSIQERRSRRGETRPMSTKNTVNRVATIARACARLRAAGVTVEDHDRTSALVRVRSLLGV